MKHRKQTEFHAYRGTSKKWGELWEKNNQWKISNGEDEYLGHGCYFFENDYEEALNWAKYNRKISDGNRAIIYAKIHTEKVYDLIDNNTYNQYIKLIEVAKKRFESETDKPILEEPFDCNILNMIIDKYDIDMVKGPFFPKNKKGLELKKDGYTRTTKTHIQLCLVNKNIIEESEVKYC